MAKFKLYWLDGKTEIIEGNEIADAFSRAGYSAGAIKALDYFEPLRTDDKDAAELLARMKYEHTFGSGEELPAIKIYVNTLLTPEAYEKLEEKLRLFLGAENLSGVIEDDNTGNTTHFEPYRCHFTTCVDEKTITCCKDGDFDFNGFPVNECPELEHCEKIAKMNGKE